MALDLRVDRSGREVDAGAHQPPRGKAGDEPLRYLPLPGADPEEASRTPQGGLNTGETDVSLVVEERLDQAPVGAHPRPQDGAGEEVGVKTRASTRSAVSAMASSRGALWPVLRTHSS